MLLDAHKRIAALPLRTRLLALIGLLLSLALLTALSFYTLTYFTGPIIDEWHCGEGEAPAVTTGGGAACFEENGPLPKAYVWDPLGNRPLSCNRRYGVCSRCGQYCPQR